MIQQDMESVQKMLEELGLSANEVRVYLAGLELGSATAQQLAAKAAVVRPTAYVAIGGLVKHGLMSSITKGKKQYFSSEKPERLGHLLTEEKKKLAARESKLKSVLPILDSLIALSGEKPEVKLYEGLEGLEAMRQVFLDSGIKEIDIIVCQESFDKNVPQESTAPYNVRLTKSKIKRRQIAIIPPGLKGWKPYVSDKNFKFKLVTKINFDYKGEISVFGEYVIAISYQNSPFGAMIKSKDIAAVVKLMFESLWVSSK